jgi:LysR family transcriptional regulator, transcriptional activator of the cysJI operon
VGDVVGGYPTRDPRLETVPLRKDKLVLICAPQHPLATSKRAPLRAIAGQRFVGFEKDIPTRKGIDRILQQHGVRVEYVMEFDNIETVKRAVEIDAGISIVPQGTVVQEVNNQTLATVDIQGGQFYRPVAAIYRRDKVLSPAMKQFLNMLKG